MLSFILKIVVGISAVYMFAHPMVRITEMVFNHTNNMIGGILIPQKGFIMNNLSDFEIELIKFINEGLLLNLIGGNELVYLRPYSNGFAHVFQCGEDTSQRVLVFFVVYISTPCHQSK